MKTVLTIIMAVSMCTTANMTICGWTNHIDTAILWYEDSITGEFVSGSNSLPVIQDWRNWSAADCYIYKSLWDEECERVQLTEPNHTEDNGIMVIKGAFYEDCAHKFGNYPYPNGHDPNEFVPHASQTGFGAIWDYMEVRYTDRDIYLDLPPQYMEIIPRGDPQPRAIIYNKLPSHIFFALWLSEFNLKEWSILTQE
jgi:hypothetical protein